MITFDHFIAIDWSARNRPGPARPTRDSVWLAEATATGRVGVKYFRTRRACVDYLETKLLWLTRRGKRVLVGWDFSFGYPRGLARALRLKPKPPWRAIWELIDDLIEDGQDNGNNRFRVGALLNERIAAPSGPFWGVPVGQSGIFLGPKRDFDYPVPTKRGMLRERRAVEDLYPRMQPAWKLAYTGSVGSQSLLGIPYVYRLRFQQPELSKISRIWPFEHPELPGPGVLHAEIYPSLLPLSGRDKIPDREQVRTYVRWLQERQDNLQLDFLLTGAWGDDPKLDKRVRRHEGWVLGLTKR